MKFTLTRFTLIEAFDLFMNQFDQYVLDECQHFLKDKAFMQVMREIQSVSALIFFVLIHIPLTKISSLFSIVTAVIPVILDKYNKEQIYIGAYYVSRAFTNNGLPIPEIKILKKNSEIAQRFKVSKY